MAKETGSDVNGIVFYTFNKSENDADYLITKTKIENLENNLKDVESFLAEAILDNDKEKINLLKKEKAIIENQISRLSQKRKFFEAASEDDVIKENIIRILMTRKGERLNNISFGSDITKFIFMPDIQINDLMKEIKRSIEGWEPRARVDEITIEKNTEERFDISIKFTNIHSGNSLSTSISL